MLPNKWRFYTSQDWEAVKDHFDSISLDTITDATLPTLGFHFFLLDYLEERAPRFIDVTDNPDLIIKPINNDQPILNSKDEKVMKRNKRVAKK